ncbi:3-oxoacyl-ACP synthase III family protein [Allostreptomyces psammosilenae]|uniref:3-oxoacyl-[acyl-carrier-protein] synthase-3 n=1 Tax=Allostreptomyces psammosilenae TaxID=1892865 RepID=A0A853ACT7_9ACTN|nr:ketoacyl-ACP synthase III [Allostreptomyces psammosilenae]NYI08258.1 3-oxoacyl-[acyl-carrier-protein] synthase-3 [Allostreptomyces psammosilenae]
MRHALDTHASVDFRPGPVGVIGTGSYLPERVVENREVAEPAGVSAEWIERKTGIRRRRRAAAGEATSDLAARAALAALADADVRPEEIGWIIVATSTPDHPQPATACLVQDLIGATNAAAFDVNAVCSGFVFALNTCAALMRSTPSGRPYPAPGLVIGADVYSRILDPADRRTAILFGDGAGAAVVGALPAGYGLGGYHLASYGWYHDLIKVPAGGSRRPAATEPPGSTGHYFHMDGRGVREFVSDRVPRAVDELARRHGLDLTTVDHLVPHQANGVMLDALAPTLGLGSSALHRTVAEYGNTGSASIPITLDAASRAGRLRDGETVLLAGFGGGMSVGLTTMTWSVPVGRRRVAEDAAVLVHS